MKNKEKLKFYIVQNQEGKYYRNKGYNGHDGTTQFNSSWIDDINKAKVYQKIGSAKGRVTYFFKNWPEYGKPKILIFEAKQTHII